LEGAISENTVGKNEPIKEFLGRIKTHAVNLRSPHWGHLIANIKIDVGRSDNVAINKCLVLNYRVRRQYKVVHENAPSLESGVERIKIAAVLDKSSIVGRLYSYAVSPIPN
jgi:hypothetical protein